MVGRRDNAVWHIVQPTNSIQGTWLSLIFVDCCSGPLEVNNRSTGFTGEISRSHSIHRPKGRRGPGAAAYIRPDSSEISCHYRSLVQWTRFFKARYTLCKSLHDMMWRWVGNNSIFAKQNFYDNLNSTHRGPIDDPTLYMGTSLRELLQKFRSKTLTLIKLLLLEKRVRPLCDRNYSLAISLTLYDRYCSTDTLWSDYAPFSIPSYR